MALIPSFFVFLVFFTVCSALREAKDEEFPFQVSIQTMGRRHLCGGAIITPKWILTASSCLRNENTVQVAYGSADSNDPLAFSKSMRIIFQNEINLLKKNRLALIELEAPISFSNTVKQAKLPTPKAQLRNTTKLCGWKVTQGVNVPPSLYVSDTYFVILQNCRTASGTQVTLSIDEFCGMDEEFQNYLFNPGTIVSKNAIVLGILAESPIAAYQPYIYVKLSEHGQWIKDVLQEDAELVKWEDNVPKDSAPPNTAVSLVMMGISAMFLRFI